MEFADYIKTPMCENVVLHQPLSQRLEGTLCITGHHFIFSTRQSNVDELWILHRMIDVIERRPNGMMGGSVVVKCKDFRVLVLDVRGVEEFNNIAYSLEMLSSVEDLRVAYPFFYRAPPSLSDGWSEFSIEHEFSKLILQTGHWRISNANRDFSLCESYPHSLVVPASVTDDELRRVAVFRQGGRFPVLCYKHEKGSVLLRSSQPMIGNQRRCRDDERLLNAALAADQKGYIIDTRPQNLAMTAKNRGGGYEPEAYYPRWRRVHKPIDRHGSQLESLHLLVACVNEPPNRLSTDRWLNQLVASNWLSHVKDTLNCACLVAQCLDQEQASVLVHGADGMDSTLQVSSLAQLILDADCRTVRGFQALVDREWVQAGYPFNTRHRYSVYTPQTTRDRLHGAAPSFLLFLDCVWQVTSQFITSFQFNELLLLELFQHAYGSQYGTFVGDCVSERERLKLPARSTSLWSHINQPDVMSRFLNPLYEPNRRVVWPSVAPMSIHLWPGMFLRWTVDLAVQRRALLRAYEIHAEHAALRSKAVNLRRRVAELQELATQRGLLPSSAVTPASSPVSSAAHPLQDGTAAVEDAVGTDPLTGAVDK